LASKLDDIIYDWSSSNTGKEYGLLAEIVGKDEYNHLTNLTCVQETNPSNYDPAITDATMTHTRKRMDKSGSKTKTVKPRPSEKDSPAVLQKICAMPWTKTGNPN
jgi:hypothetical protein